jgi:hypothetical protein
LSLQTSARSLRDCRLVFSLLMISSKTLVATVLAALGIALLATGGNADRGVGVNVGTIQVNDQLVRGGSYELPSVGVLNTGDEAGEYQVEIGYFENQPEKRMPSSWIIIQPQRFFLGAGEGKQVELRLSLPGGADPGNYFALIEAHPLDSSGNANIGAAAATKLSFTVKPSSWLDAQVASVNRLIDENEPWSYVVPAGVLAALALYGLSRKIEVGFHVGLRR